MTDAATEITAEKSATADVAGDAAVEESAGGQAAAERPEWLPELMWDAKGGRIRSDAEKYVDAPGKAVRVEAVVKRAMDAERELTRLKDQTRPPKEYTIKVPEGSAAPEWTDPKNPIVEAVLGAAKEGAYTEKQLDVMVSRFLGAFDQAHDYEMGRLREKAGMDQTVLDKRLEELTGRIRAIAAGDAETEATLRLWASTARGVELLEDAIGGKLGAAAKPYVSAPGAGGGSSAGKVTDADIRAKKMTAEYQRGDPAAVAEVKKMLRDLYGEQQVDVSGAGPR